MLAIASREQRVLVTNDRDFGELIVRRGLAHAGVILLRLQSVSLASKQTALQAVLRDYTEQLDQLLVVTEGGVRVRRSAT